MAGFYRRAIDPARLRPTSKMSLKMSCLDACGNDIKAASELYDFIAGDLDLPDIDPVRPSGFEIVRKNADEILSWLDQHKDQLMQGYTLIKGATRTPAGQVPVDVPPIPDI